MAPDLLGLTVLALLSECPRHPYDIQRELQKRHLEFVAPHPRALYHTVARLARRELVAPVETSREGRRPERTVYQITDEGREEFRARLHRLLERPGEDYPVFTVAAGFMAYLTPGEALDALEGRAAGLEGGIAGLEAALRALQSGVLPRLVLLGLECQCALARAELEWVRSVVEELRSGRLTWDQESLAQFFTRLRSRLRPPAEDEAVR